MRPLFDTESIFGIYEPGGEPLMLQAGRPGWIAFSEAIGGDPDDRRGVDFRPFSEQGLGVICRINYGYEPHGTISHSSQYEAFARRVANFVQTSRGCKIWIIGNEMNYAVERPGIQIDWSRHGGGLSDVLDEADPLHHGLPVRFNVLPDYSDEIRTTRGAIVSPGESVTPNLYARCYQLCRAAIHRLAGHEDDQVLVGAVAPWNTQTTYPGNPNGDWVQYFRDILALLGPKNCDGFALHTYTHGADPAQITSDVKLPPPFQNRHLEFRAYQDFMHAVPADMRHLPAYITETDQSGQWLDVNWGWVQQAYAEINAWNQEPLNQQIRALCLHRWPRFDKFYIEGKQGVVGDFAQALQQDYRWRDRTAASTRQPAPDLQQPTASTPPPTVEPVAEEATPPHPPPATRDSPPRPAEAARAANRAKREAAVQPYQAEWVSDQFPTRLMVGEVIDVPITIKNTGSLPWNWGGSHPFRLGYHYYRNRRQLPMNREQNLRTELPQDVAPGESITLTAHIALPSQPGNYTLELDLVHEGVTWFKEQGSKALTRWLIVEAPAPAAQIGADGAPQNGHNLPVPLFSDIGPTLPRNGVAYAHRNLEQIRYLVINHTGTDPRLSLKVIAQAHIRQGYPGIAYNFVIDGLGSVLKVSGLEEVVQPEQPWSGQGVNICLMGDFGEQPPTIMQLDAAGRLCAWLIQNLGLSAEAIVGLGELTESKSPGVTFYRGPH
ncbi:MAG: peptidoglycan recognition family protein [Caldilineaceae bacterium]